MRTRDEREGQKRNPDTNFNNQDGILIHHYEKLVSAAFTHKRTHSSAVGPTHPARKPTGGPKVCYGVTASRFHPSDFARDPPKSNLSAETNPGESTRRPMPVPFPVVLALSERRHWPAAPHPKGRCTASHPQRSTLVGPMRCGVCLRPHFPLLSKSAGPRPCITLRRCCPSDPALRCRNYSKACASLVVDAGSTDLRCPMRPPPGGFLFVCEFQCRSRGDCPGIGDKGAHFRDEKRALV